MPPSCSRAGLTRAEIDKESHNLDVCSSYPLELYLAGPSATPTPGRWSR